MHCWSFAAYSSIAMYEGPGINAFLPAARGGSAHPGAPEPDLFLDRAAAGGLGAQPTARRDQTGRRGHGGRGNGPPHNSSAKKASTIAATTTTTTPKKKHLSIVGSRALRAGIDHQPLPSHVPRQSLLNWLSFIWRKVRPSCGGPDPVAA